MRSISSIITKAVILALCLSLAVPSAALASTMDETLTLGLISVKTRTLNPLVSEEREFQSLTALMFEGLYKLDDDYRPVPCLARGDAAISTNGKTWTVSLRTDVTFHDGTPCTAYDVVATVQEILRLASEGKGQYNQLRFMISNATANNAETVVFTVTRPYFGIYYALTFPVLHESQVSYDLPLGTGPYKMDRFQPQNMLFLSAYENWHGGELKVKNINAVFKATNHDLINEYEFNRVDAAITRSASGGTYQTGLTNLNITYRTRQLETLMMNHNAMAFPLNDIKVRRAIRYAIDFDAIANQVYMGMAQRTDTPMPSGTWMYRDNSVYGYNPEKARQLLEEAGWKVDPNDDGIRHMTVTEKGEQKDRRLRLRIYYYEEQDNTVREPVANMISDYLKAVGIQAPPIRESFASVSSRLRAHNFDMAIAAFQMDVVPDPGFLLMSGNTGNFGSYKSKEMDKLFDKLRSTREFNAYQDILWQIQDQYAEDCPFVCMYYRSGALLTRKVFTVVRNVREPEVLRGIENIGK